MNKRIIIIINLFFVFFTSYSIGNESKNSNEETIKRTIMILPFLNKNEVKKYSYLSDTIRDALKAKLLDSESFTLTNLNIIDSKITEMGFNNENIMLESNAKQLALKLKADVIIFGKYIIIEDQIMIQIDALDIFTKETIASSTLKGELGLDIFRVIDESVNDISKKLKTKLTEVKKSYFIEMTKILNKENFTIQNKVGIGLTCGGGTFFAVGLGILIFDLAYYADKVADNLYNNPRTDTGYNDYVKTYYIYSGLLGSSIAFICIGTAAVAVGIPLIVYKKKTTKIVLNLNNFSKPSFEFSYQF